MTNKWKQVEIKTKDILLNKQHIKNIDVYVNDHLIGQCDFILPKTKNINGDYQAELQEIAFKNIEDDFEEYITKNTIITFDPNRKFFGGQDELSPLIVDGDLLIRRIRGENISVPRKINNSQISIDLDTEVILADFFGNK